MCHLRRDLNAFSFTTVNKLWYTNYKQSIKPKSDPRGTLRSSDHLPLTIVCSVLLGQQFYGCGIPNNNWVFIILKILIFYKVPSPKGLLRTSTRFGSVPVLLEPDWPLTTQQGVPPTGIHSLTRLTTNTIFANFHEIV